MQNPKKIVIATGIYPPEIGGPSLYAKMLSQEFVSLRQEVSVVTYGWLKNLPTGLRHIFYGIKILPKILGADMVIGLDTFSVALPTVFLCRLFCKKIIIRTGGDFLWEEYTERVRQPVLLSEFYNAENIKNFSTKEKIIFSLTKYVLRKSDCVVFSTVWQRDIFVSAYGLDMSKTSIIENVFVKNSQRNIVPKNKIIISPSRDRFLKNKINLEKAFDLVKERFMDVTLDTKVSGHSDLRERLLSAYCLVVPSFSEVSPNIVLEALSLGVPVVLTEDCGLKELLQNVVVWVNPKSPESIANGIEKLMDAGVYNEYMTEISKFSYSHSSKQVAEEFLNLFTNKIKCIK